MDPSRIAPLLLALAPLLMAAAPGEPEEDPRFQPFAAGRKFWVAGESALRERPSLGARARGTVAMGAQVTVLESHGALDPQFGHYPREYWYRVKGETLSGWLPGAELTEQLLHVDVDGDGTRDLVTLGLAWTGEAFDPPSRYVVRLRAQIGRKLLTVDFDDEQGESNFGGGLELAFVSPSEAGIPLLKVTNGPIASCSPTIAHYYSYTRGKLTRALKIVESAPSGNESATATLRFAAKKKRLTMTVMRENCDTDNSCSRRSCVARFRLEKGRYRRVSGRGCAL